MFLLNLNLLEKIKMLMDEFFFLLIEMNKIFKSDKKNWKCRCIIFVVLIL